VCSDPFGACNAPAPFVPPACPDNCTNNGICVNISECADLSAGICPTAYKDKATGKCPQCGGNQNTSKSNNYTTVCACYPGQAGINCAVLSGNLAGLVAGLTTAAIVGIIIAAIALAACAGGGGFAISNAVNQDKGGGVFSNPLYEESGASGANPLVGMHDV
jgi:hypothetical protein